MPQTATHRIVDIDDIPYVWTNFKMVRHELGVSAFGLNQIDFPADKIGKEHDEVESGQEEVYLGLAGSGTLMIEGEEVDLHPGRYVLVAPASKRRPIAGSDGMSFLVIGGVPGDPSRFISPDE